MKVKLLTIGVLALLLCATVPIAATASKGGNSNIGNTAFTYPVYTTERINGVNFLGERVGKVTFDPETGVYSLSAHKLEAGHSYSIEFSDHAPAKDGSLINSGFWNIGPDLKPVKTDERGRLTIEEASSSFITEDRIEQGHVFIIGEPPTPPV